MVGVAPRGAWPAEGGEPSGPPGSRWGLHLPAPLAGGRASSLGQETLPREAWVPQPGRHLPPHRRGGQHFLGSPEAHLTTASARLVPFPWESDPPLRPLQRTGHPFLVFILAEGGEGRGKGFQTSRKKAFCLAGIHTGREEAIGSRGAHSGRGAGPGPSHTGSFCLPGGASRRQEAWGRARDGPSGRLLRLLSKKSLRLPGAFIL